MGNSHQGDAGTLHQFQHPRLLDLNLVHIQAYGKSCQRRYSTVLTFLLEYGRPAWPERKRGFAYRVSTWFDCCDLSDDERISRNALSRAVAIDSSSLRQAVWHVLCSLHHSSDHASPLQLSWARCRSGPLL
jgi:hypothetical protein